MSSIAHACNTDDIKTEKNLFAISCLSVSLSLCLAVCLSLSLSVSPSLSVWLSLPSFVCLSVCLSLSVSLSLSASRCLFLTIPFLRGGGTQVNSLLFWPTRETLHSLLKVNHPQRNTFATFQFKVRIVYRSRHFYMFTTSIRETTNWQFVEGGCYFCIGPWPEIYLKLRVCGLAWKSKQF